MWAHSTPSRLMQLLETYRTEWLTLAQLEAELPTVSPPTLWRAVHRLVAAGRVSKRYQPHPCRNFQVIAVSYDDD